jgi:hypothetical protein
MTAVRMVGAVALDLSHSPQAAFEHQQKARQLYVSALSSDPDGRDLASANAYSLMELATLREQLHMAGAGEAPSRRFGISRSWRPGLRKAA